MKDFKPAYEDSIDDEWMVDDVYFHSQQNERDCRFFHENLNEVTFLSTYEGGKEVVSILEVWV